MTPPRMPPPPATPHVMSAEEKERRWGVLAEALVQNPGMTASEGLMHLNAEGGVAIAEGTFHDGYWRRALERVPPHVRRRREEMTAHRPGNRKLNLTATQRAEVRQLVAVLKRDHPEWHRGQVMDEVRRLTPFQFQDPVAFERNYMVMVAPAPPGATVSFLRLVPTPGRYPGQTLPPAAGAIQEAGIPDAPRKPDAPVNGSQGLLRALLSVSDPLLPAELRLADNGRIQVRLNLHPTEAVQSYHLMSTLYAELAKLAIESAR